MNLTLTIVRKTKKRNKLYYTGDDPLKMLQWVALNWHGVIILDLFFTVTTISNNLTFANKVQLNSYYYLC